MLYIKAKFTSAKVPIELRKKTTDVVFDIDAFLSGRAKSDVSYQKRTNFADFNNLIEFSQISNVLHVLLGARPAPSKRKSFHKRCDYIDNIAKKSLIKIETPTIYVDKKGKEHPIIEMTQGKKATWNSHASQSIFSNTDNNIYKGFLTWSSLKKKYYYYFPDTYNKIISKFEEISGIKDIPSKYTLVEFLEHMKLTQNKWEQIMELSKDIECSALMLTNIGSMTASSKNNLATLTINTNPVYKISLDGEIVFVFDNDNDAYNMLNGNRMATFLDGGFIQIVDVMYDFNESNYINFKNFYKISEK